MFVSNNHDILSKRKALKLLEVLQFSYSRQKVCNTISRNHFNNKFTEFHFMKTTSYTGHVSKQYNGLESIVIKTSHHSIFYSRRLKMFN